MLSVRLTFGFESTLLVRWGCGGGRGGVEFSLFRVMVRRLFAFGKGFLRHDSSLQSWREGNRGRCDGICLVRRNWEELP